MPEAHPPQAIPAVLGRLARRARAVLVARAVLGGVGAAAGGVALLALAVERGWVGISSGAWWLAVVAGATVASLAWPLREWRAAGRLRTHAARIEELCPELRGALLTVLDRGDRPMGSSVLLSRLAERASSVAAGVPPEVAYPRALARRAASAAAAGALSLSLGALLTGRGPFELVELLLGGPSAQARAAPVPDGPRAVVGDLTLRYLFPTYTRREPLEVPNSNGEVHAPPGTRVEVRARTAERFGAAVLRAYDAEPLAAELIDGRDVRGDFTVAGPGIWRFEFDGLPSPDYRIVPEPDLAPDVSVQAPKGLAVAMDKPVALPWSARDDYGLKNVQVEVAVGGRTRLVPARTLLDVPRSASDGLRLTPAELGLSPGDIATLRVGAWDNDEVSGSKPGWSAPIEVEVLGARGRAARQNRYRELLRDALVLVLADFLVEPAPAVASAAQAAGWAATADGRYAEFDRLVEEAWGGAQSDTFDATLVRSLNEQRRSLFGYARGLGNGAGARELADLGALQGTHIGAVENAILMLDEVLRGAALQSVLELVEQVAREAADLEQDLGSLDARSAQARLDQLERLFQQLVKQAAELDEGGLKEFVNDRAESAQGLMDAIRKAIAEGRMDEAQELMKRLAEQMRSMEQDLQEMQQRRQQQSDELGQAMQELKQELEQLEQDQQALRQRTEQARERHGGSLDEAQDAWQQVERLSEGVVKTLSGLDGALGSFAEVGYGNRVALEDTRSEADGLYDSVRARDLGTSINRAERLAGEVSFLNRRVQDARSRGVAGLDAGRAKASLDAAGKDVQKILDLLDRLQDQQSRTSPELARELQELAQQQQQLAERADQASGKASRLANDLPMDAPGLEEGTQRATEQGQRASKAMSEGDAMAAEGGQRAAEDGLRQAREALDEAERNLRQMQQAQSGGGSSQEGQEGGNSDGSEDGPSVQDEDFALPAPEAFETPEAYRRALLEGMSGDVPEEYKALNRRYYEELVRQ